MILTFKNSEDGFHKCNLRNGENAGNHNALNPVKNINHPLYHNESAGKCF